MVRFAALFIIGLSLLSPAAGNDPLPACDTEQLETVRDILLASDLIENYATLVKGMATANLEEGDFAQLVSDFSDIRQDWDDRASRLPDCVYAYELDNVVRHSVNEAIIASSILQIAYDAIEGGDAVLVQRLREQLSYHLAFFQKLQAEMGLLGDELDTLLARPSSRAEPQITPVSTTATDARPGNCATAVAMGLSAEEAGRWSHLDRDKDGLACYGT